MTRSTINYRLVPALSAALLALWVPIPFASVTPIGTLVYRLSAFALLFVAWMSGGRWSDLRSVRWPVLCLVGLGVMAFLQAVPWPMGFVELVSPGHALAATAVDQALAREPRGWIFLTLTPAVSRSVGLSFLAASALIAVGAIVGRSRQGRRWLFGGVALAVVLQILVGLRFRATGEAEILGRVLESQELRLRGTFANPNHAACFLVLGMTVAFGAVWWVARSRSISTASWRQAVIASGVLLWLGAFAGVLLTGSRAGLLAAIAAVTLQALLAVERGERKWLVPGLAAVSLVLGLLLIFLVSGNAFDRILESPRHSLGVTTRLAVWRASLSLVMRFPLVGAGFGSFSDAFPSVRPPEIIDVWLRAHNDYLELLVTAGLVGALLVLVGIVAMIKRLVRVFRQATRTEDRAAALVALGALLAVGVHELFDFGLTIPANAAVFSLVLGAAAGVSLPADSEP